ncbi:hypothetical protein diail_3143 [Diaporthe ilicicola]|nr:hypothetical protein diail_3143 [Diaporthe ilicicola]
MHPKLEPKVEDASSLSLISIPNLTKYESYVHNRPPTCNNCGETATRKVASSLSLINAGRPYYICPLCPWDYRWVCWADDIGVSVENPPCDCEPEVPSRLDVIGRRKGPKAGRGFWSCVTGNCGYYSENVDGTPGVSYDGGFYPKLTKLR